jgi:hypothetical protein
MVCAGVETPAYRTVTFQSDEKQPQVPFGFAQGKLSTTVAAATCAQDDSFCGGGGGVWFVWVEGSELAPAGAGFASWQVGGGWRERRGFERGLRRAG